MELPSEQLDYGSETQTRVWVTAMNLRVINGQMVTKATGMDELA